MQLKSNDVFSLAKEACRLSDRLAGVSLEALPPEIRQTLILARGETVRLDELLKTLPRAKRKFQAMSQAIERLVVLAEEAAVLPDGDIAGLQARQERFVQTARFVALMAGRTDYDLPELSLLTRPQALAARSALGPLRMVQADLAAQLEEQEKNILDAAEATVAFFLAVQRAYPHVFLTEVESSALTAG